MNVIAIHKKTWNHLQSQRGRLPHALLIIGQRGLGKFALAQAFAKSLLCEAPLEGQLSCGKCLACNWSEQGNHPDHRLLQPQALVEDPEAEEGQEESQPADHDRSFADSTSFNVGTHRAGLRMIVVNPAEAMNRNTANALLKSLEEPNQNTLFLLVSSEPYVYCRRFAAAARQCR